MKQRKEIPLEDQRTMFDLFGFDADKNAYMDLPSCLAATRPIRDSTEAGLVAFEIQALSKLVAGIFSSDLIKNVGVDTDELMAMSGIMEMIEILAKRLSQWERQQPSVDAEEALP